MLAQRRLQRHDLLCQLRDQHFRGGWLFRFCGLWVLHFRGLWLFHLRGLWLRGLGFDGLLFRLFLLNRRFFDGGFFDWLFDGCFFNWGFFKLFFFRFHRFSHFLHRLVLLLHRLNHLHWFNNLLLLTLNLLLLTLNLLLLPKLNFLLHHQPSGSQHRHDVLHLQRVHFLGGNRIRDFLLFLHRNRIHLLKNASDFLL